MSYDKPIGLIFNKNPDVRSFKEDYDLPMSDKYIGIEIEAENIKLPNEFLKQNLAYWTPTTDGSLRNYGTEFVSIKLRGLDIKLALQEIAEIFSKYNITPDYSERTSVHIHADARALTIPQLRTLILTYLAAEPYIFKWIGHGREDNSYCVPFYKNPRGIRSLGRLFSVSANSRELKDVVGGAYKYEAMNIRSIMEKGSIEFRHHYGTHRLEDVYPWIKAILQLFVGVKRFTEDDFFASFNNNKYCDTIYDTMTHMPYKTSIDLSACEAIAAKSISTILLASVERVTKTIPQEINSHWPRSTSSTEQNNPTITNDPEGEV